MKAMKKLGAKKSVIAHYRVHTATFQQTTHNDCDKNLIVPPSTSNDEKA